MTQCTHCQQRKAKRFCQALGSDLCSLCCGVLREKKIHCPPGCPYLARHKPYQEKRVMQKKHIFSEDALHDERLNWLALHIEAPLKDIGEKRPDFSDGDIVLALEYAKEKTAKGRSKLLLSQDDGTVKNSAGEAVIQSMEQCRFQRKIILPQQIENYTTDEKLKCLENTIVAVKYIAKGRLEGRAYILDLIRRFGKLKDSAAEKKILSPA